MADVSRIDPMNLNVPEGESSCCNLVHFSTRFPSRVYLNNARVSAGFTEFPYQFVNYADFPVETLKRTNLLTVCLDIDRYLIEKHIGIGQIDDTFRPFLAAKEFDRKNFVPFFQLARPIFIYLVDEKKHDLDFIIG